MRRISVVVVLVFLSVLFLMLFQNMGIPVISQCNFTTDPNQVKLIQFTDGGVPFTDSLPAAFEFDNQGNILTRGIEPNPRLSRFNSDGVRIQNINLGLEHVTGFNGNSLIADSLGNIFYATTKMAPNCGTNFNCEETWVIPPPPGISRKINSYSTGTTGASLYQASQFQFVKGPGNTIYGGFQQKQTIGSTYSYRIVKFNSASTSFEDVVTLYGTCDRCLSGFLGAKLLVAPSGKIYLSYSLVLNPYLPPYAELYNWYVALIDPVERSSRILDGLNGYQIAEFKPMSDASIDAVDRLMVVGGLTVAISSNGGPAYRYTVNNTRITNPRAKTVKEIERLGAYNSTSYYIQTSTVEDGTRSILISNNGGQTWTYVDDNVVFSATSSSAGSSPLYGATTGTHIFGGGRMVTNISIPVWQAVNNLKALPFYSLSVPTQYMNFDAQGNLYLYSGGHNGTQWLITGLIKVPCASWPTPIATPSPTPGPLTLSATVQNGVAKLSWNSYVSGPVTYQLYKRIDSGTSLPLGSPTTAVSYSTKPPTINGVVFYFTVKALNSSGVVVATSNVVPIAGPVIDDPPPPSDNF